MNDTLASHPHTARVPGPVPPHAVAAACAAVCALVGMAAPAHAFNIETDHPDLKARWDTTVGYSLGVRLAKPDAALTQGTGALNVAHRLHERDVGAVTPPGTADADLIALGWP